MATKSSFFLAVLLIANPFMLIFFQNCSSSHQERAVASHQESSNQTAETEPSFKINKNLKIQ